MKDIFINEKIVEYYLEALEKSESIGVDISVEKTEKESPYAYSHATKDGMLHISAHDTEGNKVGHAKFSTEKTKDKYIQANRKEFGLKGTIPENTEVNPKHRRKGIASKMYSMAEDISGGKINRPPEHSQTEDAKKLWGDNSPNFTHRRMFKSEGDSIVSINKDHGKLIAGEYDKMKHDPDNQKVKSAYKALISETSDQFRDILKRGLKISKIEKGVENPYKNSKELHNDIKNNNHLWYFPTSSGFGNKETKNHPMLQDSGFKNKDHNLLANDVFRIVHDINGHHKGGESGFGAKGEHQAYNNHKKMFSPLASKALATETLGQNSWVNFGPHSENNKKNPKNTVYAEQKAGLLPDHIVDGDFHSEDSKISKSEWKKRYSYILESDLEKGEIGKAVKGLVLAGTMAYGAQNMTKDPTRKPASIEKDYSISDEPSSNENDYEKQIRNARKKYFMGYADQNGKHLEPHKAIDVINRSPNLKSQYSHILKDPYSTTQELKNNKNLRYNIHSKFFDNLYKKFDGNLSHIAHAWTHGVKSTRKYIESGKSTKENDSVKRFYSF